MNGAWAISSNDVWMAGNAGALMHWDGKSWTASLAPTPDALAAVWGSSENDVYAAGANGTVLHFDGASWSRGLSGTTASIVSMSGTASDDVWMVARDDATHGALLHWTGQFWRTETPGSSDRPPDLYVVWASPGQAVWAGGCETSATETTEAVAYVFNGRTWTRTVAGVEGCVRSIAGTGPTDVWAGTRNTKMCDDGYGHYSACDTGQVIHWDGTAWSKAQVPGAKGIETIFTTIGGNIVFAQSGDLFRLESGAWDVVAPAVVAPSTAYYRPAVALAGSAKNDVWIGGSDGDLRHFDGNTMLDFSQLRMAETFVAMSGTSEADLWATTSEGTLIHGSCGVWSAVDVRALLSPIDPGGGGKLSALWTRAPDDVWVAGFGVVLHWDGQSWRDMPSPVRYYVSALWGSGPDDVYLAGEEGLFHWHGGAWSHVLGTFTIEGINAVWGTSANDVWTVSDWWDHGDAAYTNAYHFDGAIWSQVLHIRAAGRLLALGGTSPSDAWAAGENQIQHWDGRAWTPQSFMPYGSYFAVTRFWSRAADDAWALSTWTGPSPRALHFDGQRWSPVELPIMGGMFGLSGGPIWLYGEGGAILRHR